MNHWHNEYQAEYNRQKIIETVEQIRLENLALKSQGYRPGRFARLMFHFGSWMMETGKQIRKRYEIPTPKRSSVHTKRFAH